MPLGECHKTTLMIRQQRSRHWLGAITWTYVHQVLWRQMTPLAYNDLTHWGRVTHICVGNLTIIGSDNGLSPGRRQAITWTNVGILLIGPLGTNFSEMLIKIHTFSFKKIHLKMSSGKWRPFCLGLNVLNACWWYSIRTLWKTVFGKRYRYPGIQRSFHQMRTCNCRLNLFRDPNLSGLQMA